MSVIDRAETIGPAAALTDRRTEASGFFPRRSLKTLVLWVQPFSHDPVSRTTVLTSVCAHQSNVDFALPHVDRLTLSPEFRKAS